MPQSGIYRITNLRNGKTYVGSSTNIRRRWNHHRGALRRGVHANTYLQASWRKYGEAAFEFVVVEALERDRTLLLERETFWVGALQAEYNLQAPQLVYLGHTPTEGHRAQISAALRGKPKSTEHRERLREAMHRHYETHDGPNLGRTFGADVQAKMSEVAKGREPYVRTEAHREVMRQRFLQHNPAVKKPPSPCQHCKRLVKVRRHELCGACSEYFRKHGVERPLEPRHPVPCLWCQRLLPLKQGRCGACYIYLRRHGVERRVIERPPVS